MAASGQASVGGYRCEFLDDPHEYLFCQLCKRVAREATFITCCGENFCKGCITPISEAKQPCPTCKTEEFVISPNAKFDRQILNLRAHCTLKDRGCEWIGTVRDLNSHLKVETDDCQFVDVTCPNKCDQPIPRCEVPNHLQNECPKREFFCQYCNFSGSYEVVCEQHYPECEYYPIPCPNGCSVVSVERGLLEDHLKMCPYQEVQCEYAHAGCQESFLREETEKHMEGNTQKHLALVSSVTAKLGQEFECRMNKMQEEFRGYMERRDREVGEQLRQRDEQITGLEQRLRENKEVLRKSQQKMREELKTEIANEKRISEERGKRREEELKHQVGQVTQEMETKLKEKERQIQTLKQQIQNQEYQLRDQQTQITAATKKIKILEQQVQLCGKVDDFKQRIEASETKLRKDFERKVEASETKLRCDFKREIDTRVAALEKKVERGKEERARELTQVQAKTQRSIENEKRKVEEIEKRIQILDNTLFPCEPHFMMFPYTQLKATDSEWYSPPMYTHPGGYKFCINVTANGYNSSKGTHLSVYLCALPGEFDDGLRWPVTVKYTVKLHSRLGEAPITYSKTETFRTFPKHTLEYRNGDRSFVTHGVVNSKHLNCDCLHFQMSVFCVPPS